MSYDRQQSSESNNTLYLLNDSESDVDSSYHGSDYDEGDNINNTNCVTKGSDVSDESTDQENDSDGDQNDLNDEQAVRDDDDCSSSNSSETEMWSGDELKPNLPNFHGKLCLSRNVSSHISKNPSPVEIFQLFLTEEMTKYIVQQSNLYRMQNNLTQQGPMTVDDFHLLLGFLYYSSIVPLPSKSDYWSINCRQAIVADSITRNRIDYLLSILHLNDNTIEQNKAEKIEPLINLFNHRCLTAVEPESNISIDEQMIAYKGKTAPKSFKQYMPNKPTKRGFKLWAKCGVSGFVYEVKLYYNTKEIISNQNPDMLLQHTLRSMRNTTADDRKSCDEAEQRKANIKEFGSSGIVVLDFLEHVPVGSRIFVDNYFSSYNLLKKMTQLGYGLTCTMRENRINLCPVPSNDKMKENPRGYYEEFITDENDFVIIAWKDNKRVLLGSNCVGAEPLVMLKRWNKDIGDYEQVQAPQIVSCYNKHMGGVDKLDMLVALHPIPFRSKKWYTRIIWRIFDLMVVNSWILINNIYRDRAETTNPGNWRKFRLFNFKNQIAKYLLQKPQVGYTLLPTISATTAQASNISVKAVNPTNKNENKSTKKKRELKLAVEKKIRFDGRNHLPKFIPAKNASRCKNDGCKQKTRWSCSKCGVHLCLSPQHNCFNDYHMDE